MPDRNSRLRSFLSVDQRPTIEKLGRADERKRLARKGNLAHGVSRLQDDERILQKSRRPVAGQQCRTQR